MGQPDKAVGLSRWKRWLATTSSSLRMFFGHQIIDDESACLLPLRDLCLCDAVAGVLFSLACPDYFEPDWGGGEGFE